MAIRSVLRGAVALGTGVGARPACASTPDPTVESSAPSASASAAPGGNGTVFTWHSDASAGTVTINSHPVAQDGSVGAGTKLLTGPADDTNFPSVLDGVGPIALTGSFTDYWTTDVQVRQGETLASEVAAPRWCGGEGLAYNVCVLIDAARIARTSQLGEDPDAGDQPSDGTITVSSLTDASTVSSSGRIRTCRSCSARRRPARSSSSPSRAGPSRVLGSRARCDC